jgi:hypothetical protein
MLRRRGRAACLPRGRCAGHETVFIHPFAGCCRPMAWAWPISAPCARRSSMRPWPRLEQAEQRLSSWPKRRGRGRGPGHRPPSASGSSPRASALRRLAPGAGGALRDAEALARRASRPRTARASASSRPDRALVFDMLEVEAIGAGEAPQAPPAPPERATPKTGRHVPSTWAAETPRPCRSTTATTCPATPDRRPRHRHRGHGHQRDRTRLAGRIDALGNLILERPWPPRAKPRWAPRPTR